MAKTIISKFYIFTDISNDLPEKHGNDFKNEKNRKNENYNYDDYNDDCNDNGDNDNDDNNNNINEYDLRMVDMNIFGYICKMSGMHLSLGDLEILSDCTNIHPYKDNIRIDVVLEVLNVEGDIYEYEYMYIYIYIYMYLDTYLHMYIYICLYTFPDNRYSIIIIRRQQ
jgi:hypothetical protein